MGSGFKAPSLRKGDQFGSPMLVSGYSPGTEESCSFAQLPDSPFSQAVRDPNNLLLEPHGQGIGDGPFKG